MVPEPSQFNLLRDLLDSEKALRRAIEAEAQAARQALETLARDLTPELVDRLAKQSPTGLAGLAPDQLAAQIIQHLRPQLARIRSPTPEVATLRAALDEKERALQIAQAEIRRLTTELARRESLPPTPAVPEFQPAPPVLAPSMPYVNEESPLNEEISPLEAPEDVLAQVQEFRPAAPPEVWPEWFAAWFQSRGFANDLLIVQSLGDTGEPVRVRLMREIVRQLHFADIPGSLGRSAQRLHKMGLLKIIPTLKPTRQGTVRKVHLLHLTDPAHSPNGVNGLDAYRLLFGQEAVRQDAADLLARHKSAEHTYLILETQALLEKAGFTVERFPEPVEVPELGRYEPDLVAHYEAQTIYVEVERATFKNEPKRELKFRRYWEVSQGTFWIATDTPDAARVLTSEIAYQAGNLGKRIRLRLLVVDEVAPEAVPPGWEVWPEEQVF